jgi:hypothetical protein
MHLDLSDDEARAHLNLLTDAIEGDRYPLSPRVRVLREIPAKFGESRAEASPAGPAALRVK